MTRAAAGSANYDALVVGGGPAGLTAAIYLGRFRRSCLVVDAARGRLSLIPVTHNHPGFPAGIQGKRLLARMRVQARRYGALLRRGSVEAIGRDGEAFTCVVGGAELSARFVIIATGVADRPPVAQFAEAVSRGLVRVCPICDGYEVIDRRIGVIGVGERGAREALFLRHYSARITLLHAGGAEDLDAATRAELAAAGVALAEGGISRVDIGQADAISVAFADGPRLVFDTVYSALGTDPRTRLAVALGARVNEAGCILVDEHQQTSVPGLYAAGDLVRGLNQISVAEAEAAIAATDIHNHLRGAAPARRV